MEEIKALLKELLREDHDILMKISVQSDSLLEGQRDHEKRIRIVERALMYGLGALGAIKLAFDAFHKS